MENGCLIDGHWGIYALTRLIEIAQGMGFEISDNDERAIDAYKAGRPFFESADPRMQEEYDASYWVVDLAREAQDWMNDNLADPGFTFDWLDGEFFYQSDEWWRES